MLIRTPRGWELPSSATTPQSVYLDRRRLLGAMAGGSVLAAGGMLSPRLAFAADAATAAPADAWTLPDGIGRNPRYELDRPVTEERFATSYNNFVEFGSHKGIAAAAQALPVRPWLVTIDGMVEKPLEIDIDQLLTRMPEEERLYRHRCVEAWSMAVPWLGFPLKALVEMAQPLSSARYLQMTTFHMPDVASGQRQYWYPWPYVEGLTLAEATNELAFIATGLYGKRMPAQNGAPLRLVVPWKYGFKSVKSITHFTFTDRRPYSFWERIQANEYGFWANVNPDVPHPRWSQATERVLGTNEQRATQIFNGYGAFVSELYSNLGDEPLYM